MTSKEDLIKYIHAKQREIRILSKKHTEHLKNKRLQYKDIQEHSDNFLREDYEYYNRCIMIPGLRGIGKTTIIYQLYNYLTKEKNVPEKNIFYLDVHELKTTFNEGIQDIFELYLEDIHQTTLVNLDEKVFFFVDEAQFDENWAKYAKILFDKSFNVFCIFTGSSALDLEVNTDAARRLMKKTIFPCNFQEYLLLKHNLNLSQNNFKDLILKGDSDTINKAIECEKLIKHELINLDNDPEIEFKKYLHSQGFPFALKMDEISTHLHTNEMIEKIVSDDLKSYYSYNNGTDKIILRIINYLATKKPGNTSSSTLAQSLNINVRTVNSILAALEKSQLIFSVAAYGSAGKMLKKPPEYFFLTPSLKSAQNYRIGKYDLNHDKCYATLLENQVASSLYRLSKETQESLGIFYDSKKKGVDFIVKHLDKKIPIEVGIGKKTKSQVKKAMNRYDCDYGILVSNRTSEIEFINNVLYVPILTFALI